MVSFLCKPPSARPGFVPRSSHVHPRTMSLAPGVHCALPPESAVLPRGSATPPNTINRPNPQEIARRGRSLCGFSTLPGGVLTDGTASEIASRLNAR